MQRLNIIFDSISSIVTTLGNYVSPIITGISESGLTRQVRRRTTKYNSSMRNRFKNSKLNKTMKRAKQLKNMSRKDIKSKLKQRATRKLLQPY